MKTRHLLLTLLASATALMGTGTAMAQQQQRPIRLVVPYAAGGPIDNTARILAERVKDTLGPVIIDNKPGAGGNIGADIVAKAPPDGLTIGIAATATNAVNPWLYNKIPFNAATDFAPITQMVRVPNVLVMNADTAKRLNINSVADLIRYAKANPAKLNYGSGGNGSAGHLAGELLKLRTGTQMTHIPYRGGGPAVTDVMGGQVPLLWVSIPAAAQFVKAGKLKALAVSTTKRSAAFPDVPTMQEAGIPDFDVDSWYAVFVPAKTPQPAIDKLNRVINTVVKEPEIRDKLLAQGSEGVGGTPEQLGKVVTTELVRWQKLAKEASIKVD